MIYIIKINLFHNQTNINQYKLKQIYVITDHMDKLLQCIQILRQNLSMEPNERARACDRELTNFDLFKCLVVKHAEFLLFFIVCLSLPSICTHTYPKYIYQ